MRSDEGEGAGGADAATERPPGSARSDGLKRERRFFMG